MKIFIKRNVHVFFADKMNVFFSLLSTMIMLLLYILFLGETSGNSFKTVASGQEMFNYWLVAGLVCTTSVTGTVGAFSIMVEDRSRGIIKDFLITPINRKKISGAYLIGSFLVGLLLSLLVLLLGQAYVLLNGGRALGVYAITQTLFYLIVISFSNTAMIFALATCFESISAFGSASTIVSTLIGFITGVYVPLGSLPNWLQGIIKAIPVSHGTALLRQSMMSVSMSETLSLLPAAKGSSIKESFGIVLTLSGSEIPAGISVTFLLLGGLIFFVIGAFNQARKKSI